MKTKLAIFALLAPALLAQAAGNSNTNNGRGANRTPGQTTGDYTIVIAGQYTGRGTAKITNGGLSLSGTLVLPGNATATFTANSMKLSGGRFSGTGMVNGVSCTLTGRVDLPNASDQETTDAQALTARLSATLKDASGKMARIIGIQDEASRGGSASGTGNGNGSGNGNGNGIGNGNTPPK
jgi:hypothetical protein